MKPILFNTEMVQAILSDWKTATRRVIKPQPQSRLAYICMGCGCGKWGYPSKDAHQYWNNPSYKLPEGMSEEECQRKWTPPCHTDDILYVRETWTYVPWLKENSGYLYRADYRKERLRMAKGIYAWHPSIHMPKEAARIFLRVKSVRAERLQDIDEDGATKEGCTAGVNDIAGGPWGLEDDPDAWTARESFAELWDITIKLSERNKYGWAANPWVWVIEFERCEKPQEVSHE